NASSPPWSCSTSACPAWTATKSAAASAPSPPPASAWWPSPAGARKTIAAAPARPASTPTSSSPRPCPPSATSSPPPPATDHRAYSPGVAGAEVDHRIRGAGVGIAGGVVAVGVVEEQHAGAVVVELVAVDAVLVHLRRRRHAQAGHDRRLVLEDGVALDHGLAHFGHGAAGAAQPPVLRHQGDADAPAGHHVAEHAGAVAAADHQAGVADLGHAVVGHDVSCGAVLEVDAVVGDVLEHVALDLRPAGGGATELEAHARAGHEVVHDPVSARAATRRAGQVAQRHRVSLQAVEFVGFHRDAVGIVEADAHVQRRELHAVHLHAVGAHAVDAGPEALDHPRPLDDRAVG